MNKKVITIVILIILTITCCLITISSLSKKEVTLCNEIESLIADGNYTDALLKLNSIPKIKDADIEKKLNNYKSALEEYSTLKSAHTLNDNKVIFEDYLLKYSDLLATTNFKKLKQEVSDLLNSVNENLKDISNTVLNIENLLSEEKVTEAENSLKDLKEKYPSENFDLIVNKIQQCKSKIEEARELAEKEEAEILKQNNDKSNDFKEENIPDGPSQPRIANTSAAKNSNQLITVVSTGGVYAELVLWQKDPNGTWYEYDSMPAKLGEGGMKYFGDVYEMDKCTPTGNYSLTEAFGINNNPGSSLPYRVLDGSEYWVDDINSEYYNTLQFGDASGRWNSAEHLISFPGYYNYAVVIDYNRWPVVPGKSSAIFIHCDLGVPTYGCVAVEESKLINMLQWLNPSDNPRILLDFNYENIFNNY